MEYYLITQRFNGVIREYLGMTIVNGADLDWEETEHGDTEFRRKQLSANTPGDALGCSLYEIPAGRKSWPYHYHAGNTEALYVLAGRGKLRWDGDEYELVAGDYTAFPPGEAGAHRVINPSDEPLRYLMLSTMRDPDVTVYPDSEKFGVYAGSPPGRQEGRTVQGYYKLADEVSYWEGE